MMPSMRVFISHARADAAIAQRITAALREAGIEVVDPEQDLHPGDNWALEIGKALEKADAMVALISPASASAIAVEREIMYALGEERFEGRFVPVVVKPTRRVPWILDRIKTIEVDDDPAAAATAVVAALKRRGTMRRADSRAAR